MNGGGGGKRLFYIKIYGIGILLLFKLEKTLLSSIFVIALSRSLFAAAPDVHPGNGLIFHFLSSH